MTATTITALPKNKTGIFAGDTLQETKLIRNQPTQPRHPGSGNLLLISNEQNRLSRNGIQSYYPTDGNSSTTNDSSLATNGIRNGFRPSTVRRQKARVTTAMKHRDNSAHDLKDISTEPQTFTPSPASARLKSEIDQLNNQLKIYGDLNKILRLQNTRDTIATPQSALSYSTSYRLSSASTNHTPRRNQQYLSSAITNETLNTLVSIPGITDTSNKILAVPSSPYNEEDNHQQEINSHITHAYQIPQQSNVGSESIFPLNPPPSATTTTNKIHSAKNNRNLNTKKPVLCPFYVMYFTNLAMQQRPNDNIETKRISSSISTATTTRKGTVSSRYQSSNRRQVHSPLSINTYSTIDDDNDSIINTTSYYNHKRFSAKMAAFESENSTMLKDVLRTTSWNHLQV